MTYSRDEMNLADKYINEHFAQEDDLLLSIRKKLREDGKEGINVSPYEGKILQFLIRTHRFSKVVEIGTLYGYSAIWMARGLPEKGQLFCLEKDEQNVSVAKSFFQKSDVANKIELLAGEALESLQSLSAEGPFDMVFIDANKNGYLDYLLWAEAHVRPGGMIVGDNTFLFGNVFNDKSKATQNSSDKQIQIMREFNQRLADSSKYHSIMLPTHEGMTIAQKVPSSFSVSKA